MKVVMFVSNAFTHDPRVYAEARALVQAGYEVTVIAWDREKQNSPRQNLDGIEIIRRRSRLLPKRQLFGWTFLVALNLLLWQRQAYRRALALNKEKPIDVIHCHDLDTLAVGIRLKRKLKIPLIYDAHEIYGYMMARIFGVRLARIFLWMEKRLVREVDRIVTVTGSLESYFDRISTKPVTVIMNCKPLQALQYEPPDNEQFTLVYMGVLHKGRAVPLLVRAAKDLPGVRCLIVAMGRPGDVEALKEECSRTSNVAFLGKLPLAELIPITRRADCVFSMSNPADLNNRIGLGNRQFAAMVCGRPIICTKGTYAGELIEREGISLTVDYDVEALRAAIIKLRDDPELRERLGRNALKAAITKYNWQRQEEKLLALYQSL